MDDSGTAPVALVLAFIFLICLAALGPDARMSKKATTLPATAPAKTQQTQPALQHDRFYYTR